jgi:hypothetical protein
LNADRAPQLKAIVRLLEVAWIKGMLKACISILFILAAFQSASARDICDRVSEIRVLPFKGEYVDDSAYNALMEAGRSAVPCLIAKITDTRKMHDPRQAPTFSDVRVGDVAYFVLVDIATLDFTELLPARVQQRYKAEGVYAYFRFVRQKRNRGFLQRRLNEWYRKNTAADHTQHNKRLQLTARQHAS